MDDKKNIGQLFDRIAGTYDTFNHLLSLNIDRSWRRKAVRMLRESGRVLDVAIGTADLAIEVIRQGKASSVDGIDLSTEMMRMGAAKVEKAGMCGKISFREGSALELPYADASFDAVTCAYGVRNFSELDKGLEEFYRVLVPGGQAVILEFSYPSNRVVRFFYDIFFSYLMPVVGRLVSKDPSAYKYFRQSVKNFIWGEEMLSHISAAGFVNASFKTLTLGITTVYIAEK